MMLSASKAWLVAGLSFASCVALGAESTPKKPDAEAKPEQAGPAQPDIKFLEYLGTLEDDAENWTEIAAVALAVPASKPIAKPEAVAKPAAEKK